MFSSPVAIAASLLRPSSPARKSKFSEADVIRLVKLLVRYGADANNKFVLSCIYGANGFGIFKELLSINADMGEITLQIALICALLSIKTALL
ncbi:hypothetical protein [uncultured Campylobacter sp.]|uniref:hypothetical protein n=1 Tax=uncultured Campylobacter sp. TaxID=218934 RepID=UPI003211C4AE